MCYATIQSQMFIVSMAESGQWFGSRVSIKKLGNLKVEKCILLKWKNWVKIHE